MDIAIIRFDAPLMSFGGAMVDQHGVIDRFPGRSFLTGLFGNAFGYEHKDSEKLNELQSRIEFAARWDIVPEKLIDYHTVDLGEPKMKSKSWTTRGRPEHREGGESAKFGTHQRYRHYWANGLMTLATTLLTTKTPSTKELGIALTEPFRPLFLGRKTCLPSTPIFLELVDSEDVFEALSHVPLGTRTGHLNKTMVEACWPAHLIGKDPQARLVKVYDQRDWNSQLHTGNRLQFIGRMEAVR